MRYIVQYLDWILAIWNLHGLYVSFVQQKSWASTYFLCIQVGWIIHAIITEQYGRVLSGMGQVLILGIAIRTQK